MSIDIKIHIENHFAALQNLITQLDCAENGISELQARIGTYCDELKRTLEEGKLKRFSEKEISPLISYRGRISALSSGRIDPPQVASLKINLQSLEQSLLKQLNCGFSPIPSQLPKVLYAGVIDCLGIKGSLALARTSHAHANLVLNGNNYWFNLAKILHLSGEFSPKDARQKVTARIQSTISVLKRLSPQIDLGNQTCPFQQLDIYRQKLPALRNRDQCLGKKSPGQMNFKLIREDYDTTPQEGRGDYMDRFAYALKDLMANKEVHLSILSACDLLDPLLIFCSEKAFKALLDLPMYPEKTIDLLILITEIAKKLLIEDHKKIDMIIDKLIEIKKHPTQVIDTFAINSTLEALELRVNVTSSFQDHLTKFKALYPLASRQLLDESFFSF